MIPRRSRFARDVRGAVAVEFALLAPLLLVFYFGMAELTQAMMAQRRLFHATSLIGDMAAQNGQINQTRVNDIYNISLAVMKPFPASPMRLCLYSVTSDTKGKDTVAWVSPKNSPTNCPAAAAVVTDVPESVLPASSSVIISTTSYDYKPTVSLNNASFTFRRTYYLRPRRTETVEWSKT
ncbi:pilus assembly protein TadE [Caulobacter flavus]|uniref:Pilus assembly protein TadE n=1 Tax=Caulobacter flavus TaxID=1679497 RepID=A0A2N5CRF2_9CAUL|nr:TadE/TadG family type IV pilus assembly protein [Caulobacter flavus]AYV46164.1 pilus assembly protein TadE [Caulobacter flavus]PLR11546.1 pilus assembly protein TadE [Caulobacter flavus]